MGAKEDSSVNSGIPYQRDSMKGKDGRVQTGSDCRTADADRLVYALTAHLTSKLQ